MKRGRKPSLIKCCPKCGETDRDKFGLTRDVVMVFKFGVNHVLPSTLTNMRIDTA